MSLSPACKPELPSAVLIDEAGSQLALAAPENTLSPGKWSWVGKKEYGMVPAALPTSGGDRSCHGDDVRAALAGHHGQGVGMEGPAGRQQVTQDLPFLAAHSPACNPPSVYQQPQGTGKRGCQRLACAGRGPARSGSWEGPIQRTVSLVIVIRVILQQLESCFCAGVAWLYGSEGGERNTGNGSDGSRIISWRERRAADATEGNKDRDSEGFIHDFVLETAQTNRLNPSLQHTYLPSGTSPPTQSPCPELWAAGRPLFGDTQRQL